MKNGSDTSDSIIGKLNAVMKAVLGPCEPEIRAVNGNARVVPSLKLVLILGGLHSRNSSEGRSFSSLDLEVIREDPVQTYCNPICTDIGFSLMSRLCRIGSVVRAQTNLSKSGLALRNNRGFYLKSDFSSDLFPISWASTAQEIR